jgi:hypothetical protein
VLDLHAERESVASGVVEAQEEHGGLGVPQQWPEFVLVGGDAD